MSDFGFWDERYGRPGLFYGAEPNVFLAAEAHRITPGGAVLSIGDGEGRNGVWLAGQGFQVTTVDGSAIAVGKAKDLAAQRRVTVDAHCADLTRWAWPRAAFHAVVSIFVHFMPAERAIVHARIVEALRPGGLLIIEAFHPDQVGRKSGGPPVKEMLCDRVMLAVDFAALDILVLEEREIDLDEGRHKGPAAVTRLIARRFPV